MSSFPKLLTHFQREFLTHLTLRLSEHCSSHQPYLEGTTLKHLTLILDIDRERRLHHRSIFQCMALLRDFCSAMPSSPAAAKATTIDIKGWYFTTFEVRSAKRTWLDLEFSPSGGARFDVREKGWTFRIEGQDPLLWQDEQRWNVAFKSLGETKRVYADFGYQFILREDAPLVAKEEPSSGLTEMEDRWRDEKIYGFVHSAKYVALVMVRKHQPPPTNTRVQAG